MRSLVSRCVGTRQTDLHRSHLREQSAQPHLRTCYRPRVPSYATRWLVFPASLPFICGQSGPTSLDTGVIAALVDLGFL